jgi:hypothetical protein
LERPTAEVRTTAALFLLPCTRTLAIIIFITTGGLTGVKDEEQ